MTRNKLCTMLLLSNLAYPQWISIDCDLKILDHVVCIADNRPHISQKSFLSLLDHNCPNKSITKHGECYAFSWFNGKVLDINMKGFSHKEISQPCLRNEMTLKLINDIETMDFLFESIDEGQLVFLSPHSTNISLIDTFSYQRIFLRALHKQHIVNYDEAMGYIICKGGLKKLNRKVR